MSDFISYLYKILNKLNFSQITVCIIFLLTLCIILSKFVITSGFDPLFTDRFLLMMTLAGLVLVGVGAIKYLDSSTDKEKEEVNSSIDVESIVSSQIAEIMKGIQRDAAVSISKEEKESLLADLRNQFETKTSEEYYQDIKQKIKREWLESEIDYSVRSTTARLKEEINTLKLRSNLNLVIGMILCFSGIIALYVFLQKNAGMYVLAYKDHNINEIILTLLPNAFFVLLIEIFSYFFLNLYKKSIEEIKFYQNELTNLESKFLALKTAKITNNHKLQCIILEEIVKTERNFILEPGQSTIEIEKEKISSTNSNNVIKAATELLNFKK